MCRWVRLLAMGIISGLMMLSKLAMIGAPSILKKV